MHMCSAAYVSKHSLRQDVGVDHPPSLATAIQKNAMQMPCWCGRILPLAHARLRSDPSLAVCYSDPENTMQMKCSLPSGSYKFTPHASDQTVISACRDSATATIRENCHADIMQFPSGSHEFPCIKSTLYDVLKQGNKWEYMPLNILGPLLACRILAMLVAAVGL